tara:strand:+ start:103082 stop:103627 length:546 start_codon:yes stop_codon:yes gene_type:complete
MDKSIRKEYLIIYLSPITKYLGFIFFSLGLIGLLIIGYLLALSDLNWETYTFPMPENVDYGQMNLWLPYMIPGIAAGLFFTIGGIILLRYYLKRTKILRTVSKRPSKKAIVIKNIQNFYVQVNNVPRREVSFQTEGGSVHVFKFFSEHLATLFKEGSEVEIVTDGDKAYPAPEFITKVLGK